MDAIVTDKILKRFKGINVLDELSLSVKEGEIFGIVGRSGCGKTTLLKVLIGMLNYDLGTLSFNGERIHTFNKNLLKENIGFSSQENMLYDELTLSENIRYYGKLYGIKNNVIKSNANQLLKLFELENFKNSLLRTFSGGMKKRANILVSLIHNPKVLILDEPTAGLDPILRENIWYYIKQINKIDKTIIVTSHLLEELQDNCTTIAFMDKGKIAGVINTKDKKIFAKKSLNEIFKEWMENG
ncbi:MAG: ABC transporter ATP-binding protein [Nanoarchaeota archaeon]|nr:ABC transporter ATP-binding protein [Nanoarchaeota archaeon]